MSDLLRQQQHFAQMVALLIRAAFARGYQVTLGDAYRDPRVTYGHPQSYHRIRLAIDLNLFGPDGRYLTTVEEWRQIGELWETMGGTWGGRWSSGDANHLSLGEGKTK